MIYELFSKIRDEYFNIKTRVTFPALFKRFPALKNGEVKLEYASNVYIAGFSMFDSYELLCHNRLVKYPVLSINSDFYKLDKGEVEPVIAHELGHYHFFQNISPEKLRRRALWNMVYRYRHNNQFLGCIKDVTNDTVVKYLVKYLPNEKRMARLKKWNLMKEVYADNKAAEAGYGDGLLKFLKKFYEKNDSMADNKWLYVRIKNLESKLMKGAV